MAKNAGDVILRDRMQFTLGAGGSRTTLYGRIDLSSYVDPVNRQGLAVKEVRFQMRDSEGTLTNTGIWAPIGNWTSPSGTAGELAGLKLYATTRAYENASEVGIASPDVLCVYEIMQAAGNSPANEPVSLWIRENWYGPKDLHPEGYTVVSDLLIGVAADGWDIDGDGETLEVDIMLIAEPVSISTARMNEILSQAQDL
jgi:hypothetical protein